MNHDFKKLLGAAIMSGLGLWTAAMPAHASAILGIATQTSENGVNPLGPVNAQIIYNSVNGGPINGAPAGVSTQGNDPTASYSFSPNPSLALGGLAAGSVGITAAAASTQASADLLTGTTHILGMSTDNGTFETSTTITVEMEDFLTFTVTGNNSTIAMGFSLDGLVGLQSDSTYDQQIRYSIGSADMEWEAQGGVPPFTGNTSGFDTSAFTNDSITGFNFLGTFTVTDGEVLEVFFTQSMACDNGATCDFSNTGQMSLNLPSGVSFTSTGGFLSQPVTSASAPEPGSLLLMGLGMAAIGYFGRRRLTR
jgi:PEP-CTERM motif-containing protein